MSRSRGHAYIRLSRVHDRCCTHCEWPSSLIKGFALPTILANRSGSAVLGFCSLESTGLCGTPMCG